MTPEGAVIGAAIGGVIGAIGGGLLGGAAGSVVPGVGTLSVGAAGMAQGAIDGAIIGGIIGDILTNILTGNKPLGIPSDSCGIGNGQFAKPPNDAHDPDGAKAPGKPGTEEGFVDPKGGENWVPNPNGRGNGWLDADGDVWIPTGQGGEAHGGPHWDVQTPGGGHVNVYPGGRRR